MSEQNEFNETELRLIAIAKRTLKILAKVIKDRDPEAVKRGIANAETLDPAELERLIQAQLTPDQLGLNPNEEARLIGGLAPVVFAELLAQEHR